MINKSFYLVVGCTRNSYSKAPDGLKTPRVASGRNGGTPATKPGEVAIKIRLSLPESLFSDPSFSARIEVSEDAVTAASVDADVINNIESVVAEATGLRLTIDQAGESDE